MGTLLSNVNSGRVVLPVANFCISNACNFLVRSIAQERGVPMPSFFGYMALSGAILIPLFIVVTFAFL